jgi:hypothetical protein
MGYDATRAKEYYRTSFPNSSPKFHWLNGKATKVLKIGTTKPQFQKIGAPAKTNLDPWELIRLGLFYAVPFRQIGLLSGHLEGAFVKTVRRPKGGTDQHSRPQPPAFAVVPDIG